MLKLIVFSLFEPLSLLPSLIKECKKSQISICFCPSPTNETLLYELIRSYSATKEECLFIADRQEILSFLKKEHITTIGIQTSLDQFLSDTTFVTDSVDELSFSTISMVFSHDHGEACTILTTDRTIVREFSMSNMREYYALLSEPQIKVTLEELGDYESEKEKLNAYIKTIYHFYLFGLWGVFDRLTGQLIGQCGISIRQINHQTEYELGYLISSNYEGRSYAFECSQAVLNYAFTELGCTRIVARIHPDNSRSIALAKRLGFTWETDYYEADIKYKLYVITNPI